MNIHQSEVAEFFKAMGQTVVVVADDQPSEYKKDELLGLVDENRLGLHRPRIESELKDQYVNEAKGLAGGTLKSQLARNFGMSVSDFKDLKDEDAIIKAVTHFKSLQEGEKEDVNKKLEEILSKHKTDMEAKESEWSTKLTAAEQRYIERDIKEYLFGQLKEAPIPQSADRMIVTGDFMNHLQANYHLKYDDAKRLVALHSKDTPDLPALNENKTAAISILDEAKSFLTPRGLWEVDLKNRSAADEMKNRQTQEYQSSNQQQTQQKGGTSNQKATQFMADLDKAIAQAQPA